MLFKTFFASKKYRRKSWGLSCLLLIFLGANLYINLQLSYFAQDLGDFWKQGPLTHEKLLELITIVAWVRFGYFLNDPFDEFFGRHFGLLWRRAVSEDLMQRWSAQPNRAFGHRASQLIQHAVYESTVFLEQVGFQILRSLVLLFFYIPKLWVLSPLLKIRSPWVVDIPGVLAVMIVACALVGGLISFWIGQPLIEMGKHNQEAEASLRTKLESFEQGSEPISTEVSEPFFQKVYASYSRMWLWGIPFKGWNTLYWHAMLLLPIYVGGGWYVDGIVRFGVLMRIFFLFNEASMNFSTITNNWGRILDFLATYRRLKAFSDALDSKE